MPSTARDIGTTAMRLLGVYAPGETPSDADIQEMFTLLNDMIDSWSTESLTCYAFSQQSATLTPGTSQYTIGPGGTFNMTRPIRLVEGPGAAYIQDVNGNNYMVEVLTLDQWNLIGNRSSIVNSNFPNSLFYDPQYPLGLMNFFPQPNASNTAYWTSLLQFTRFSGLTATVSLPPGYELALKTNLAVWAKPYFTRADIDPDLRMQATKSKANIKRSNDRDNVAVMEPELYRPGLGGYSLIDFVSGR